VHDILNLISWKNWCFFYILLTVHHVIFPDKWPTWCTILFCVFIFIFNSLHVSSTSCSSSGETNCVNTTSDSCHSVSVVMSCASQKFRPAHNTATDTEWQLPAIVLTQFVSPDDEHDVLKTCRELKIKVNTQKRIVHLSGINVCQTQYQCLATWGAVNYSGSLMYRLYC
jgi:hypothetical protein